MLLVQCGEYILGPFGKDSDLRRFGLALAERSNKSAKRKLIDDEKLQAFQLSSARRVSQGIGPS